MKNLLYSRFLLCLIVILLALCACNPDYRSDRPFLVLYAFDAEGKQIASALTTVRTDHHLGRDVKVGDFSGHEIVLAESGMGMTNAAMTAQRMIDKYRPSLVLFSGIAGALDSSVQIGDIVVPETWIDHDYGYVGLDGFIPGKVQIAEPLSDTLVRMKSFPVDSNLLDVAREVDVDDLELAKIAGRRPRLLIGGTGVSGNKFIDSREKREWLATEFSALVTDMESAAVAQVCRVNGVPFLAFRSASDLAGGSGSETADKELDQFFRHAADNSSKMLLEYLREL
jgi:adenosylhomocysteine nucleosidase